MPRKPKQDDPTTAVDESLEEVPLDADASESLDVVEPAWSQEELLAVKHLGPAIIGEAMHEAAIAVAERTSDGRFGPALL